MKDTDKNFDYFREILQNDEQTPDAKLWNNINKRISARKRYYKKVSVSLILLTVAAVATFVAFNLTKAPPQQAINTIEPSEKATQSAVISNHNNVSVSPETEKRPVIEQSAVQTPIDTEFNIDLNTTFANNTTSNNLFNNANPNLLNPDLQTNITVQRAVATIEDNDEVITPQAKDTIKTPRLIVPNAFTPTANSNTIFKPAYTELKSYKMQIFDRQGRSLFRTTLIEQGWNGEASGRLCNEGSYLYVITFETLEGVQAEQRGAFLLSK